MILTGYVLASTPRSGTTMTCDLLRRTGVAGWPESWLRMKSTNDFRAEWGLAPGGIDADFVQSARVAGRGDGQVFALRLMAEDVRPALHALRSLVMDAASDLEVLEVVFGPLKFIHIIRQDKVAQAVSRVRAEQSGLWHRNADGSELERLSPPQEVKYDFAAIDAAKAEATAGDAFWQRWFDVQGIKPLVMHYEEISASPSQCLRRVLDFVGLDVQPAENIKPGTARLSDTVSKDWQARFHSDSAKA